MVLEINGLKIGIEFKRGQKGSELRSGIGQSMVYATHYDFVLYLFVDTSDDSRIKNAQTGVNETEFIDNLWNQYNIKFIVA
jgi:Neuraminidase (sialidase)